MIDNASLETSKCVKVLSGTGVEIAVFAPEPPDEDPDGGLKDAWRDVPFTDVVAFEEMPVLVLALDRTDGVEEPDESAELELTLRADVAFAFTDDNAEVEDAGLDRLALLDADSSAFPPEALAPEPAPDDEPAVFDATAVGAVEMELD